MSCQKRQCLIKPVRASSLSFPRDLSLGALRSPFPVWNKVGNAQANRLLSLSGIGFSSLIGGSNRGIGILARVGKSGSDVGRSGH